jgi:alkylresorcinol/alkylpyrone synthase
MNVHLHAVTTALPPNRLKQDLVEDRARAILGPRFSQFERMAKSFTSSGVVSRHSVAPLEWFSIPHGWSERNRTYREGALAMFEDAARRCLAEAGWQAAEVDTVVTVSSTGVSTPTLEAEASRALGFREDIKRVPVFGLGCAGGVSGLAIAQAQAAAEPGAKVLLVVVEACTVSFRSDRLQKADIIATVLFGDGAAAVCLSSEPSASGPEVTCGKAVQQTWPDTLDIMGWEVEDSGLGVVFDRSIPDFVLEEFAPAVDRALEVNGFTRDDIEKFICHPGGAKVVRAIEETLSLRQGTLAEERDVLRDFGNMSAPTVLFVLKAVIAGRQRGQMMACALGPGFTASFLPLRIRDREADATQGVAAE